MREKKELNIQIGKRIKAARERMKITQEDFAERIEVSPQYVSDLERGVVGVSIPTLKRLCLVLGVSSDQILFGESSNNGLSVISEKCKSISQEQFALLLEIVERYIKAITIVEKTDS